MTGVRFQDLPMLHLMWLIPLLAALHVYAWQRRKRAMGLFIEAGLLGRITVSVSRAKRVWKAVATAAALTAIVLGLARPGWNPKPKVIERRGRDVVFLLDVSRSMLAEDLAPNRLERARMAIRDCIELLRGDRVALVAFAGTAVVKCPLTLDYGFFRMMLDDTSVDSVSRGGTMIGDAIRKVVNEVFDNQDKECKDIILITDGEDHESFPVEAAQKAGEKGIRLIAVGLGDENEGRRIPVTDGGGGKGFMKYKGSEVWTKLDADTLRKMVNVTPGGKYLPVATGAIDLGAVYTKLVTGAEKRKLESETIKRYEEKFQVFLMLAFVLLGVEMVTNDRKRERNGNGRHE